MNAATLAPEQSSVPAILAQPLRLARLLFHPLALLIVPATLWHPGNSALPRNALARMADHIQRAMGDDAQAIASRIAGHTQADTDLITHVGNSLWPDAARILRTDTVPESWSSTGLSEATYRPLATTVATLLEQIAPLDALAEETANGFLPLNLEAIAAIFSAVAEADQTALPMLIALLLLRVPEAAGSMPLAAAGLRTGAIQTARDHAIDRLLLQLDQEANTETQIAAGTLADAAAAAGRINTLLRQIDAASARPPQRARLRSIRQRLDASCKARFSRALEADFRTRLRKLPACDIRDLESVARDLRVLEMQGRTIGSSAAYDALLQGAVASIMDTAMRDRLTRVDRIRLVEVLTGPQAALAMLDAVG